MTERARLPRVYADHVAQTVVMTRAADPVDPEVFVVAPTLVVRDLAESVRLLRGVMALHVAWEVPDPPTLAFLAVEPWSGSAGLRVLQASEPWSPGELHMEVGISVDQLRTRVVAAGLSVLEEPADQPWFRRTMAFLLPDGNVVRVSGPTSPAQAETSQAADVTAQDGP
jgi:catechol 2,3-dioxygenase-like lactoylglutathione lyase family enzyme